MARPISLRTMKEFDVVGMRKYRNTPTLSEGVRFDSKAESEFFDYLRLLEKAGEIVHIDLQTTFTLPGYVKYRCDFVVYWKDGKITVYDVKGMMTRDFKLKKKLFDATHPLKPLVVVKKGGHGWTYS